MSESRNQIQIAYNAAQDRLLLRVKTVEHAEFRLWLTRRFVKLAWPALVQLLAADEVVSVQHTAEARQAVLAFEHEKAVSETDFKTRYAEDAEDLPLGEEPLLVNRMNVKKLDDGKYAFVFQPAQGRGMQLRMGRDMIHSVCKLLADTIGKIDWDLDLKLTAPSASAKGTRKETLQ